MLTSVALTDELWSGIAVVAAPAVEREHRLEHGTYAVAVFAVPFVVSAAGEALLSLLSDRFPRRHFVGGGLALLSLALILTGLAPTPWALSLGLALAGIASGAACAAAQSELVLRGSADRALTRWTAHAAVGDLLAPLLVACALVTGHSYRLVLVIVGVLVGAQALLTWRARGRPTEADHAASGAAELDDEVEPLGEVVRASAWSPRLWVWLGAAALCTLLDEIAAALAALHLRGAHGLAESAAAASLTWMSLGSLVGATAADRWLPRLPWRAVLSGSCVLAVAALALFLLSPGPAPACAALMLLGAAAAPHYALTKARAYEALPERPGLVNAAAQVFVVLDILAPPALGFLADRLGTASAIALLAAQPLGLLSLAVLSRGQSPLRP